MKLFGFLALMIAWLAEPPFGSAFVLECLPQNQIMGVAVQFCNLI